MTHPLPVHGSGQDPAVEQGGVPVSGRLWRGVVGADTLLIWGNQDREGNFCLALSLCVASTAALASPGAAAERGIREQQSFLPQPLTPLLRLGASVARLSTEHR